jgi:hypothetical protein
MHQQQSSATAAHQNTHTSPTCTPGGAPDSLERGHKEGYECFGISCKNRFQLTWCVVTKVLAAGFQGLQLQLWRTPFSFVWVHYDRQAYTSVKYSLAMVKISCRQHSCLEQLMLCVPQQICVRITA